VMHAAGAHDVDVTGPSCCAAVLVRLMTAPLAGGIDGVGIPRKPLPAMEAILMNGRAARDHLTRHPCRQENTPFEFTRWMQSQSASSLHAHFAIASGAVSSPTGLPPKRRPRAGGKTRPR
jgi:hypothetical protein